MNSAERFARLIQTFFCDYLIKQRDVSLRTVAAYRDTFRLLLNFLQDTCGKRPDQLALDDLSAANLLAFLQHLEKSRGNCVRTRNCRLAALRSFFHYATVLEGPELLAQNQQIMAIPLKRFIRPLLSFLSVSEMTAILQASGDSWTGRRDHILLLFLYNTGARVSEAIAVRVKDVQRYDYRAVQLLGNPPVILAREAGVREKPTAPRWPEGPGMRGVARRLIRTRFSAPEVSPWRSENRLGWTFHGKNGGN